MKKRKKRRTRAQKLKTLISFGAALVALTALMVTIVLIARGKPAPDETAPVNGDAPDVLSAWQEHTPAPSNPAEAEITPAPIDSPAAAVSWQDSPLAPKPLREGYLPVFRKAKTEEKKIAITVDDCYQTENLRKILQISIDNGSKLTIFPIGKLLHREDLQEVLRYAHSMGFELENHTYSHSGLHGETNEGLAYQVYTQDYGLGWVLGGDYAVHFLRPKGGDSRDDFRTHQYAAQLGYLGIAHWSTSGSGNTIDKLKNSLAPGEVYLFHTTDLDLEKLEEFIPYARSMGYELVTMNELFGYAQNLVTEPAENHSITPPPLENYHRDYQQVLSKTTYSYMALEVQKRLNELGYYSGNADGVYGAGSAEAAKRWQRSVGENADGKLTGNQLRMLLEATHDI